MTNSLHSNQKLTENINLKKEPARSEAKVVQPAQSDWQYEVESLKAKLKRSCCKEAQLQRSLDESERTLKTTKCAEAELRKMNSHLSSSVFEYQSTNKRQSLRINELEDAWKNVYAKNFTT